MDIKEITEYDYVLVQPDASTSERAKVIGIDMKSKKVIVKLSDNEIREMHPQYIIKSFG